MRAPWRNAAAAASKTPALEASSVEGPSRSCSCRDPSRDGGGPSTAFWTPYPDPPEPPQNGRAMRSSRAILAAVVGVVAIGTAAWWSWRAIASEEVNVRGREERGALHHRADEFPVPAPELEATRSDEPGDRAAKSGGHGPDNEEAATRRP